MMSLSQNELAVTPNGLNWLFLRPNTAQSGAGVNPPYTHNASILCFPFMVWLILQNKPIGEYVKRLLIQPRVRPHRPFMGKLLKTELGATMQNLLTITAQTPRQQQVIHFLNHASPMTLIGIGAVLGLPIACLVIGLLAVMGV